jgi:hypothetical protein
MAIGDSYATTAELKTRLRITDATYDTQLGEALSTATLGIEHVTGRQFNDAGSASARVFYPDDDEVATVDDFHTTTGLVIATDTTDDGTFDTTWTSGDYQLEPLNGVRNGRTGWPYCVIRAVESLYFPCARRATLQVTARWGWSAVPAPVKEACLILAEDIYKLRDTPFGAGGFGEFGRIRARENPHVMTRIGPYMVDEALAA